MNKTTKVARQVFSLLKNPFLHSKDCLPPKTRMANETAATITFCPDQCINAPKTSCYY